MKKIKIINLYSDAMDLYGDKFNIKCVEREAVRLGFECEIVNINKEDELSLSDVDMVYIGHGKARNLNSVYDHAMKYKEEILSAIEKSKVFLVTGSSRLLFGKSFENDHGEIKEAMGLFDYKGSETGEVFVSDVVSKAVFDESLLCYGFINRTAHIEGNREYPLFQVLFGAGEGRAFTDKNSNMVQYEGNHYKNFFGTWQMGPFLARNPKMLEYIMKILIEDYKPGKESEIAQIALNKTLAEFDLTGNK